MKKYRVFFAVKSHVVSSWFRRKERIETEHVVVLAHNEAHAVKEARLLRDPGPEGRPLAVVRIEEAPDEALSESGRGESGANEQS